MKSKVLRKLSAITIGVAFSVSALMVVEMPVLVYADTVADVDSGAIKEQNNIGDVITNNNGTVTYNYGTVTDNYGTVTNNVYDEYECPESSDKGKVENNHVGAIVENNREGSNVVNNDGTVTNNVGTISKNAGTVVNNAASGTVFNLQNGKIENNGQYGAAYTVSGSTIENNYGTVFFWDSGDSGYLESQPTTNHGNITNNYASMAINSGTITNNFKFCKDPMNGCFGVNGNIGKNSGTVKNNFGTITYNSGTVENNFGTVGENQAGGTVNNQYYKVTIEGANTSFSGEGVKMNVKIAEEEGRDVTANFAKEATAIVLSGTSGYRIVRVLDSDGQVFEGARQMADGTWQIEGINSAINFRCEVELIPVNNNSDSNRDNNNNDSSETQVEVVTIKPVASVSSVTVLTPTTVVSPKDIVIEKNGSSLLASTVLSAKAVNGNMAISVSTIESIKQSANVALGGSNKNVNLCVNTVTDDGQKASVLVSTANLQSKGNLVVYTLDPVTGGYVMSNAVALYDKNGGLMIAGLNKGTVFSIVSAKEAKEIEKAILNMVKLSDEFNNPVTVSAGGTLDMSKALTSTFNRDNVSKIEYKVSGKKATIDPVTGQLTINDNVTKGTITVSIKVTLINGKTKTLKTKVKVS